MKNSLEQFKTAIANDNVTAAAAALKHAEVRDEISNGMFGYGRPPLLEARSPEMIAAEQGREARCILGRRTGRSRMDA